MTNTLNVLPEVAVNGAWPPLTTGATLQWDASSGVCRPIELHEALESSQPPTFRVSPVAPDVSRAQRYWTSEEICCTSMLPVPAIAWEQEASRLIFSIAEIIMVNSASATLASITSELAWFPAQPQSATSTLSVHPVILGRPSGAWPPVEYMTIVPCLPAHDPLGHHMALVLQTAIAAQSRAECLYAETLSDALMIHFLRRYVASQPVFEKPVNQLAPYKLQRTLAYIQTHLAQKLSLSTLAHVAQMSPTHFAHLFKHTTGLAPHRYVILYRIEQAKRLLGETDMSLIDIGSEVGFSDQSHFTALFRKHVSMTPKTYRDTTLQG